MDCDEIYPINESACPSCASTAKYSISNWIVPLGQARYFYQINIKDETFVVVTHFTTEELKSKLSEADDPKATLRKLEKDRHIRILDIPKITL